METNTIQLKTCTKCGIPKSLDNFTSDKSRPDGKFPQCGCCRKLDKAEHYQRNKEAIRIRHKQYRLEHLEEEKIRRIRYQQDHKQSLYEARKEWKKNNPDKLKASRAKYRRKHKEAITAYNKSWAATNVDKVRAIRRKAMAKKNATIKGNLNNRMRTAMGQSLSEVKDNKNGRSWESLVGYTVHHLRAHLESLFTEGMSWELFLTGAIAIDHIIPLVFFIFDSPSDAEFQYCWSLYNLRPLWKKANLEKHDKLDPEALRDQVLRYS